MTGQEPWDLDQLLLEVDLSALGKIPRDHLDRTPQCPRLGTYPDVAQNGWPNPELAIHGKTCAFCQKTIAAIWNTTCPGWLRARDPDLAMAFGRHKQECDACQSKANLLGAVRSIGETVGEWTSLPWSMGSINGPGADDGARAPLQIAEYFDGPQIAIEIRERRQADSIMLEIAAQAKDHNHAAALVEVRLTGGIHENSFALRLEDGASSALHPIDSNHFRDLDDGAIISVRLTASSAVVPLAPERRGRGWGSLWLLIPRSLGMRVAITIAVVVVVSLILVQFRQVTNQPVSRTVVINTNGATPVTKPREYAERRVEPPKDQQPASTKPPQILAFALAPSKGIRSGERGSEVGSVATIISIPRGVFLVRLEMALGEADAGDYAHYTVMVSTSGREVWRVNSQLPAPKVPTNGPNKVLVTIPSEVLRSGEYVAKLAGTSPATWTAYFFRVIAKD